MSTLIYFCIFCCTYSWKVISHYTLYINKCQRKLILESCNHILNSRLKIFIYNFSHHFNFLFFKSRIQLDCYIKERIIIFYIYFLKHAWSLKLFIYTYAQVNISKHMYTFVQVHKYELSYNYQNFYLYR